MIGHIKSWLWHWMSLFFLIMGILSIILILWVRNINERLHTDEVLVDAVKEAQIRTATAHLWLEEITRGEVEEKHEKVVFNMDQAINLVDVILSGGETEHHKVLMPLEDSELRVIAEDIKSLLIKLKAIGMKRLQDPEKTGIGSVLYEEFHDVFREVLGKTKSLEATFEANENTNQRESKRLFLGILIVWTFIITAATIGFWKLESYRRDAEKELKDANDQLLSQAEELGVHRDNLAGMVEKRTAELTTANRLLADEIIERKQAEQLLRETEKHVRLISYRLLNAQENERKRISMELHDELGQALNAMKLQTRVIEKRLRGDQPDIKKECEELLLYMDQVIENVRRLSLDLSPVVLEDIGLTSALRWLLRNLMKDSSVKIVSDIAEIDDFISENHRIVIYRVVQEALTNIVKHAESRMVSLIIQQKNDNVIFIIEDNGKGFDPDQSVSKEADHKGLGLTTMNERVRMIGGMFEIWSQEGKGTCITFTVPAFKLKEKTEDRN